MKFIIAWLIALVAFSSHAESVEFRGFSTGYDVVSISVNGYNDTTAFAGGLNAVLNNNTSFVAYCIDVGKEIKFGVPAYTDYKLNAIGVHPFPNLRANIDLARLFGSFGTSVTTQTQSAAFQTAIWEITYETSGTYDITGGSASFISTPNVLNQATAYLTHLGNISAVIRTFDSPTHQDMITSSIPEPDTWMLIGFGLSALILNGTRKHLKLMLVSAAGLMMCASAIAGPKLTEVCSWDRPGSNRFIGNVVSAVDNYIDIPAETRTALKYKISTHQFDDVVVITRNEITGRHKYDSQITSMHFGTNQICNTITRLKWNSSQTERGMVYCEKQHCLILPSVCGNLARIVKILPAPEYSGPISPVQASQTVEYIPNTIIPAPPTAFTIVVSLPTTLAPLDNTVIAAPYISTGMPQYNLLPPYISNHFTTYVTPVPEPSSWVMVLLGLAVIKLKLHNRK